MNEWVGVRFCMSNSMDLIKAYRLFEDKRLLKIKCQICLLFMCCKHRMVTEWLVTERYDQQKHTQKGAWPAERPVPNEDKLTVLWKRHVRTLLPSQAVRHEHVLELPNLQAAIRETLEQICSPTQSDGSWVMRHNSKHTESFSKHGKGKRYLLWVPQTVQWKTIHSLKDFFCFSFNFF